MSIGLQLGVGAIAMLAAFVAGLLGAGGDILFVPLLLYALPAAALGSLDVHTVTTLSLVLSLISTGVGGIVYFRDGRLDRAALRLGWRPLMTGALAGGLLSRIVPGVALLAVFALVTTGAAGLLMWPPPAAPHGHRGGRAGVAVTTAMLAGGSLLCGAVGVGGGFLIITILLWRTGLPMALARGTGLALTACTAAPALLGKILTGQLAPSLVPVIVVAGAAGVVAGERAGTRMAGHLLRSMLAVLVAVLAVRVWFSVIRGSA